MGLSPPTWYCHSFIAHTTAPSTGPKSFGLSHFAGSTTQPVAGVGAEATAAAVEARTLALDAANTRALGDTTGAVPGVATSVVAALTGTTGAGIPADMPAGAAAAFTIGAIAAPPGAAKLRVRCATLATLRPRPTGTAAAVLGAAAR